MSPDILPVAQPATTADVLTEIRQLRATLAAPVADTLTVDQTEAARLTGLSAKTLERRADAGEDLGRVKVNRRVLYLRKSLERWLESEAATQAHANKSQASGKRQGDAGC